MSDVLLVKIVLPSKVFLEMEASMVNIPGTEGMFGVLAGHAKQVASIDVGVVTLFSRDKEYRYFVYGGIAQVTGDELNIVSEFAADLAKEKAADIRRKISDLESSLTDIEPGSFEADVISGNIKKYQSLLKFI